MLDDLIDHFRYTENRSLLARIYGVFTFSTDIFDPLDIIIMQNTARVPKGQQRVAFDLKGSLIKRKVRFDPSDYFVKDAPTLKDVNFLEVQIN